MKRGRWSGSMYVYVRVWVQVLVGGNVLVVVVVAVVWNSIRALSYRRVCTATRSQITPKSRSLWLIASLPPPPPPPLGYVKRLKSALILLAIIIANLWMRAGADPIRFCKHERTHTHRERTKKNRVPPTTGACECTRRKMQTTHCCPECISNWWKMRKWNLFSWLIAISKNNLKKVKKI